MAEQEKLDGYPPSPRDDLDPGPDVEESLEEADSERANPEHGPSGRHPEGSIDDEDRLEDAHDADAVDDATSRPHLFGGRGPVDRANFNDNTAEWSREKTDQSP